MLAPTSPSIRLEDVARAAGVSPITVSRALRTPDQVAARTRARVEEAARRLGYVPNLLAGALASARTRTVGVLVPTTASSVFAATINGLTEVLEEAGFAVLMAQSGYDADRERRVLAALLGYRPEGVVGIGAPLALESTAMLTNAARAGVAIVETWEVPAHPIGSAVGFDNKAVGQAVARRFAAMGRRRLVFLGGTDPRATARFLGFTEAAREAGLPRPARLIVPSPSVMDHAAEACRTDPALATADAVFASTDILAVGALTGFRRMGRQVPGDVAVTGLGDLDIARHAVPALTTVRIDGAAIGRQAAALILTREGPVRTDLGFTIIERDSG
jgi:LacI family gluconate utilization system Gnt-I transcriptional repressor